MAAVPRRPGRRSGAPAAGCPAADPCPPAGLSSADELRSACTAAPGVVSAALERFDFRAAIAGLLVIVEAANRFLGVTEPWHLARAHRAGEAAASQHLGTVMAELLHACQVLCAELQPFLPDLAGRIRTACDDRSPGLASRQPLFPRIG